MAVSYYPPEMDAHLWRAYRSVEGQLKIGVVLQHAGKAPLWVTKLLYLLIAEPAIKLDVVYRVEGVTPPSRSEPPALFRLLQKDSERYSAPLAIVPMVVRPACCFIDVEWDESAGRFTSESRSTIQARQLDALIWLDALPAAGDCAGLARLGVWSFALGDPSKPASDPPYWREIAECEPVSTIALLRHPERLELSQTISTHTAATVHAWHFTENAEEPTTMAGPLLIRGLLDALSGQRWAENLPPPAERRQQSARSPSTIGCARFVAQRLKHSLGVRAKPMERRHGKWSVAIRPKQSPAPEGKWSSDGFQFINKPAGSQYADPFLLEHHGQTFLFFEEVAVGSRKGRISAMEIGAPDHANGLHGDPFVVLEAPYHLSYPVVFAHDSEIFLLPESAGNNAVSLYRARHFPGDWERCANLVEGMSVVDTTPFLHNSVWYFFVTTKAPGIETFLFYSDRLEGRWQYHPMNPICSDARRARGAGAIFEQHGRCIRPAQDSAERYGSAIVLNEIVRLSTTDYEERPVETIRPNWRPAMKGIHTYNSNHRFEAVDALLFEP